MANEIGFDTAAWMVDGARIPGDLSRVLAYAATGGAEGVVSPGDCRVHELVVPGGQIEIDPGALIVLNRSAGVRNQSYVANARNRTLLDVGPTGSSGGRSDLVVLRLRDPQFKDWGTGDVPPEDLPTWQYAEPIIIPNVPPTTTAFQQLALDYSGYALARLDIPAETGTITDAMVKNLREVANPQRLRYQDRFDQAIDGETTDGSVEVFYKFPANIPDYAVRVPDWATQAYISANITGLQILNAANLLTAHLIVSLTGGTPSQRVITKVTKVNENIAGERNSYVLGSKVDIPVQMRGALAQVRHEFRKVFNSTAAFRADHDTQIQYDIEFLGAAV